ncbi:MAG: trigger factor [Patescibacteria group bacterium]|nr:trigger factor [Patescibacteria group bacterium]
MQLLNQNKLDKGLVELEIEVEAKELTEFIDDTIQTIIKEEKFSGFRQGKATVEMVRKKYSEMDLLQKSLEKIITVTYYEILMKEKLLSVGQPEIQVIKMIPGNPFVYKAKVALLPTVKIADLTQIKIVKEPIKVENEHQEKILKELQMARSQEKIVEREAKKSDKVMLDIEMSINKVPLDGGQTKNTAIMLGDDFFLPGLDKEIIGLKKNDQKEFTLTYPQDYHDKKLANKKVDFKVKVNEIYEMTLPEINDEFAKSLGKFNNLAELKKQLAENLQQEAEAKQNQDLENEMFDKLIQVSNFGEIPEVLIENEKDVMLKEMESFIQQQGMKFEDYLTHLQKDKAGLKKGLESQALKRLKVSLIIREIVKQQDIQVTDEELQKEIDKILEHNTDQAVKEQVADERYKSYLRNALTSKKALDYLKDKVIK